MAWAELAGDWLEPLCGEAVPELPSFFLASLLPSRSLARESCSCCQTSSSTRPRTGNEWERGGVRGGGAYHSLSEALHDGRAARRESA